MFDDMIADMESHKKNEVLKPLNCFQEEENLTLHLFLYQNLISKCLKL